MTATDDVIKWVKEFVEVPHPVFADLPPCPYAKQARLDGKVDFVELTDDHADGEIWQRINKFDSEKKDVLVIIAQPDRWTAKETVKLAEDLNKHFKVKNLLIMEDHPDIIETVKEVKLNQGKYTLLFVQNRSKVAHFEKMLRNTDYYKNWDPKYEKEVTGSWRHPVK